MEISTRKALFTLGLGAFGRMAALIKNTEYLPQKPAYLFKLLKMANAIETKSSDMAKELTKDKELVSIVLNVPSLASNYEKLDQEDYINAISNLEKTFIQSSLEVDFAKKYFKTLSTNDKNSEKMKKAVKAASIAKSVCKWVGYKETEIAFFATLLVDLPEIVLATNDPESVAKVETKVADGMNLREAEIVVHGFDHNEFGAKLFKYYSMPQAMEDLSQNAYKPDKVKDKHKQLAQIVNFSRFIAECFSDKTQSPSSIWQESQTAIHNLGLKVSAEEWGNKISLLFVKSLEFEMSVIS